MLALIFYIPSIYSSYCSVIVIALESIFKTTEKSDCAHSFVLVLKSFTAFEHGDLFNLSNALRTKEFDQAKVSPMHECLGVSITFPYAA